MLDYVSTSETAVMTTSAGSQTSPTPSNVQQDPPEAQLPETEKDTDTADPEFVDCLASNLNDKVDAAFAHFVQMAHLNSPSDVTGLKSTPNCWMSVLLRMLQVGPSLLQARTK